MFNGTAGEYLAKFKAKNKTIKPRRNWVNEVKAERRKVIDEVIATLKRELRDGMPTAWERGYYSAITKLEIMKIVAGDNDGK